MKKRPSPATEHAKTCTTCRNRSITEGGLCPTGWQLLAQATNETDRVDLRPKQ